MPPYRTNYHLNNSMILTCKALNNWKSIYILMWTCLTPHFEVSSFRENAYKSSSGDSTNYDVA